ncbi:MAG: hypothetical protein LKF42_09025 [Streptococcaceae bacterium]|jgi:uncharacterized phage protein (TIGR01671 family)|nr:hypothetical protein [Streptococcaceae bacterium]
MIPKIKVWDKVTKRVAEVDVIYFEMKSVWIRFRISDKLNHLDSRNFDEVEFIKSTGLKGYKDNNSEESDVFKGDIIDIFWEDYPMGYYRENHLVGEVDLDETGTAWIIKKAKYDFDTPRQIPNEINGISVSTGSPDDEDLEEIFLHDFNLSSDDIKILGNIYDNPDLIEQEEDE